MVQSLKALKLRIKDIRCENSDHRWFVPLLPLREILSQDVILKAVRDAGTKAYHLDEVVDRILSNGLKIFAILVLTDQAALAFKFIQEGELLDERLPFSLEILKMRLSLPHVKDFYEKQWELSVPTFDRGTIHKSLDDRVILPFIRDKRIGNGAFGTVYEIELNHNHQQLQGQFQHKVLV